MAGMEVPAALEVISSSLSVCPTSPATGSYVSPAAPAIAWQCSPEVSHLSHWSLSLTGSYSQVPSTCVTVSPSCGCPRICGGAVLSGGWSAGGGAAGGGAAGSGAVGGGAPGGGGASGEGASV